jgi:hypothetical protein
MRFLHRDFGAIAAYLAANPSDIRAVEWELSPRIRDPFAIFALKPKTRSARPPRQASAREVGALFDQTQRVETAGAALGEYFHINAPPSDRPVSLRAAIEHVEAFGAPGEFLVVGHPEGGVVSVSRRPLPFQEGLAEAKSWGLDSRWTP